MNLKVILEQMARRYPDKAAIVLGQQRLSYAELDSDSGKLAHALRQLGVKKGDRVAAMLSNSPEYAAVYFGVASTGAITVPLDTRYKPVELAVVLASCQPKVLLTEQPFLASLATDLSRFPSVEHVIDVSPVPDPRFISYRQIVTSTPTREAAAEITQEDIALINYTSGPITNPRGAMITHHNLITDATMSAVAFRQTEKDVVMLFALPIYHMFGFTTALLCAIIQGSTIIMVPGTGISINSLLASIEKEKGTILLGVPYIFSLAAKMAKREGVKNDLSSLRLCASGGAPLPVNVIHQFKKYYGLTILNIWGLTEAVSHVTCPPLERLKIGTAGKPLPGWDLKIDDNGKEVPPSEPGEIIIKGPTMSGYYNNPKATRKVLRSGWLHTGDIGILDEEGYLRITGRKKKMIILKGQNVYPGDIEKVLLTHPRIATAKVVGIPDNLRGEIVGAIITPKYGETITDQEVRHYCQQRMADYRSPKQIIFTEAPQPFLAKYTREPIKRYLSRLSNLTPSPYKGVEDVLRSHPKIAEARVYSMTDRVRGEILKAVIRIKEGEKVTEAEIRHFCQQKLSNYKFLRQITFTKAKL
ncbi:AMP-binding protein [Chloroflexota bacterium]